MSATKTAKILDMQLAIDEMPTAEILWHTIKRQQVRLWLTCVYALTLTVIMVAPTVEKIIHFFGL